MKTVQLLIPDQTYERAAARARDEGFDPRHYLSNLLIDEIDRQSTSPQESRGAPAESRVQGRRRDTLEQIFALCRYVWTKGLTFHDAVRRVADDFKVQETTVRDKCTRRISLPGNPVTIESFLRMLSDRNALCAYLCRRFPGEESAITSSLSEFLETPLLNKVTRDRMMRSLDDTETS